MTTLRKAAPEPVRRAGRQAYLRLGTVTAPLRLQPSFVMIGAQRCGTTTLFRALMAHPQVVRPAFHKGINFFDLHYHRGMTWYRGHFPVTSIAQAATAHQGGPVSFEASGYYLYHPFALERMARDMPGVKLIVMLRDPAERAYSAYKHEYARGYEWESFEKALDLESERLLGEWQRMKADVSYESFCHRHHSYVRRGQYAEQLERAFSLFPPQQVHVIDSEKFFAQPAQEYDRLIAFLGLRPHRLAGFGRHNARPGDPMQPHIQQRLEEHFAPHNQRLAALLGWPEQWPHPGHG
jgi:sulfotransferase family protein